METYKDIPGYERHYQVSDFGNVKSTKNSKEKVLIPILGKRGYLQVSLSINNSKKVYKVHQLVAMAFLDHTPKKHSLVVNHINLDRTDNRLENLEVVTNRENCNLKHISSSSKYVGVSWRKDRNKWAAEILIDGKRVKLGHYEKEIDAHLAYDTKLKEHLKQEIEKL
jgi:hypothetical protein